MVKAHEKKILTLLQSGQTANIDLAWQLIQTQGFDISPYMDLIVLLKYDGDVFMVAGSDEELFTEYFRLKEISHIWKQMGSIPQHIGLLRQLRSLNFGVNKIKQIPESLCDLFYLKRLDLSDNHIKELPTRFSMLKQLESLYLAKNRLEYLPEDIHELSSLRILDLSENPLITLPVSIQQMHGLRHLRLHATAIPEKELSILKKALPDCEIRF